MRFLPALVLLAVVAVDANFSPTRSPSKTPTGAPTAPGASSSPSRSPTHKPSSRPSLKPTASPTRTITATPSAAPIATVLNGPDLIDMGGGPQYNFYYKAYCANAASPCTSYLVHMKIVNRFPGWIGVGVAGPSLSNSMTGGHAVIGCSEVGRPAVGLYALQAQLLSDILLVPGSLETNGIFNASFHSDVTSSTLEFLVNQNTAQAIIAFLSPSASPARRLATEAPVRLIFAQGGALKLDQHAYRAMYSYDLLTSTGAPQVRELTTALAAHIILAMAAFGFLLPLGATCALCHHRGTTRQGWFVAHRGLQTVGAVTGVSCWIAALVHVGGLSESHFTRPHHVLGMAVIVGVFFQVVNGFCRPHLPADPHAAHSETRNLWYGVHRVVAFFVLVGGAINIILGPDVFVNVYLGSGDYYSLAGYQYSGANLKYFVYALGGATLAVVLGAYVFSIFCRKRPEWELVVKS